MILLDCVISGRPVPKGRPRAFAIRRAGRLFARVYTPVRTERAERELARVVKWCCRAKPVPTHAPVLVTMGFDFRARPGRRGDLDNLVKLVLDALTGVIWKDDSQVLELRARMNIGRDLVAQTHVRVETIEPEAA